MPFKNLIIPRPGGIHPIIKPEKAPLSYKLFYPLFPVLKLIAPKMVITSVELSKVLLHLAKTGSAKIILENPDLKKIYQDNFANVLPL